MHKYATLEQTLATLRAHPGCRVYGRSVQGRDLLAVELGDEGPRLLVTAGLHGLEWIGIEVAMAVLRAGAIPNARLLICPLLNPDGVARTESTAGDAPMGVLRKNANGVDLNRNFPLPYSALPSRIPFAGATQPGAATYRGPNPLSEPESRALIDLLSPDPPVGAVNLHSFMGTLIAARVWDRDEWRTYSHLARAFRSAGGTYVRVGTPVLDVFTGELEDWLHHAMGCWSVCVECFSLRESLQQHLRAPTSFARFNPADPRAVVARDGKAVRGMLEAMRELNRPTARAGAAVSLPWGRPALT